MVSIKKEIAIIGVGLMGGSLGLALKSRRAPYRIIGIGRDSKKLNEALKLGVCDQAYTNLKRGLKNADIVAACTPVDQVAVVLRQSLPHVKPGCILTDVGSVKGKIVSEMVRLCERPGARKSKLHFIGGHPLAGSEKTGAANALPGLYQGATMVLCPAPLAGNKQALNELIRIWSLVGAQCLCLDPLIHDVLVAQTSHLPHVLASLLVKLIGRLTRQDPRTPQLLAGSFRDMTRIAGSDPNQWSQISSMNQSFLIGALKAYRDLISRAIENAEKSSNSVQVWQELFGSAQSERVKMLKI